MKQVWVLFAESRQNQEDSAFLRSTEFLVWLKKFGLAQNTLGPVKGQGINVHFFSLLNDAIKSKLMYESLVLTSSCMIVKLKRLKHAKMQMI